MTTTDAGRQADTVLDVHDYVLDVDEAARLLAVSVDTVRRYARSGKLASMRVQGERIIEYRFRPADVEAMQAGRQVHTGTQAGRPTHAPRQAGVALHDSSAMLGAVKELVAHLEERYQSEIAAKDTLIDELRRRAEQAEQRMGELTQALADRLGAASPAFPGRGRSSDAQSEVMSTKIAAPSIAAGDTVSSLGATTDADANDVASLWATLAERAHEIMEERPLPSVEHVRATAERPHRWWAFWRR